MTDPSCPVCRFRHTAHFAALDGRDYWRCPGCKATFLDPSQLPDRSTEQANYRLHRNDVDDPGYRRYLSRLTSPLLARLSPGQSGLDYGCGPGPALADMLAAAGHPMALYDPLFHDDASALEQTYAFITCTEVAEHFHRPFEEFERLDGLLEPDGWLAIMTTFQTRDDAFAGWHYRREPTHVVFYREETFRVIARQRAWLCEIPCANVALLQKQRAPR